MGFTRLFTHNWQVKVVAFFLAVALWLYTSGQARIDRTLTVHVGDGSVHALPPDYQVTSIAPGDFGVELDGPSALLGDLGRIQPNLEIAADALARGQQTFPIGERILGLPADVRVRRVQPENIESITVSFGRIVEEYLDVEVPSYADEPPGVSLSINLDKQKVRVRGAQKLIDELKQRQSSDNAVPERLRFKPVPLATLDPKISEQTRLRLQLSPVPIPGITVLDAVNAEIIATPRIAAQRTVPVPIELLVPPDFFQRYRVELSQSQVALTVHGPQNLLQELAPAKDLVVYLNLLRGVQPDDARDAPLAVIGPSWATTDEVRVRFTVRVVALPPASLPMPAPLEPTPLAP